MASIEARKGKNGTTYRVYVVVGGQRCRKSFDRLTDARQWGRDEEARLSRQAATGSLGQTVADAIDRYFREELPALAATERRNRESQLAWWRHRLEAVALRKLGAEDARAVLRDLASGADSPTGRPLAYATTNRYKAALSAVLSAAVEWGWAESNPLHQSSRRKRPNSVRERERDREITPEEFERLLAAFRKSEDPRLAVLTLCARASGARQGELMRLRFEDADLDASPAQVEVHDTKSGGESRMLYFPGEAGDELRRLAADPHPSGYFFGEPGRMHEEGPPAFPTQAFRYWSRRSGVEDAWFHDLRHSWACELLDLGETTARLMILGGWKSVAMVRRYAKRAQRRGNAILRELDRQRRASPATPAEPPP